MPNDTHVTLEQIVALRGVSTSLLGEAVTGALAHDQARAQRLAASLNRLGPHDPRAVRLKGRLGQVEARRDSLRRERERLKKLPKKREAWMVAGQLRDPDGRPLDGLTVKLVATDPQLNKKLTGVKTDANGDFVMAFTAADLGALEPKAKALTLTVKKNTEALYTSRPILAFAPWSTDYFELTLTASS